MQEDLLVTSSLGVGQQSSLALRYQNEVVRRGYNHMLYFTRFTEVAPIDVIPPEKVLVTSISGIKKPNADVLADFGGALVNFDVSRGYMYAYMAGESPERVQEVAAELDKLFPTTEDKDPNTISISFWGMTSNGPSATVRKITINTWEDIHANYSQAAENGLEHLMNNEFRPGHGGQLLLWSGEPGTGKTTALRALAGHWRDWCTFHYITDPEEFFGRSGSYMMRVLLDDQGAEDHWRCLILEDTGELLSADAKAVSGQAVSRLLNVVDGIIGQGLNVLVLVTTNEPIKTLYPAMARPGRCASRVEFTALQPTEIERWAHKYADGLDVVNDHSRTVADLFAEVNEFKKADIAEKKPVGFGFDAD